MSGAIIITGVKLPYRGRTYGRAIFLTRRPTEDDQIEGVGRPSEDLCNIEKRGSGSWFVLAYPGIELAEFKENLQDVDDKQTVTINHFRAQHDQKQAVLKERGQQSPAFLIYMEIFFAGDFRPQRQG